MASTITQTFLHDNVQVTQYSWYHSSKVDTFVNQDDHVTTIRSSVRGKTGFSKSRSLRPRVPFLAPPPLLRRFFAFLSPVRMRKSSVRKRLVRKLCNSCTVCFFSQFGGRNCHCCCGIDRHLYLCRYHCMVGTQEEKMSKRHQRWVGLVNILLPSVPFIACDSINIGKINQVAV